MLAAAARQTENAVLQLFSQVGLENVFRLPADIADDPDPGCCQQGFQFPGNGPADNNINPGPGQIPSFYQGIFTVQMNFETVFFPVVFDLKNHDRVCGVKKGRNTTVPVRNR